MNSNIKPDLKNHSQKEIDKKTHLINFLCCFGLTITIGTNFFTILVTLISILCLFFDVWRVNRKK